jgi:DNA-binding Lrp family transcriptional regulator
LSNVELRLISELMKNSRRSDRELGKVLGISQPTVSRMIKKLEKEGVIKEYNMMPDFAKLGYERQRISLPSC